MEQVKSVIVGDYDSRKNDFLFSYKKLLANETMNNVDYIPVCIDFGTCAVKVDDKTINLEVWDTSGGEDFPKVRTQLYPHTHVFIVCFSIIVPNSLENVLNIVIIYYYLLFKKKKKKINK